MNNNKEYTNSVTGLLDLNISNNNRNTKILYPTEFIFSFKKFTKLCESIKFSNIVRLSYNNKTSFLFDIIPHLLLCRFYSKKVVLEYRHLNRFTKLDPIGWLSKRILKQFHLVLIDSEPLVGKLSKNKINCSHLLHSYDTDKIKFKLRNKLQPLMLVDLSTNDNFNLHCVMAAYKLVKQKYPRTEILIVNSDEDKIKKEYNIDFEEYPGIQRCNEDLTEIVDRCDIYLNSRYYEFLPSSMIKAFGSGIPVISTPIGIVDKIINRKNLLMYKFNDHNTLSDLIIELIENPNLTEKLSNNGRYLSKEFNTDKISSYYQLLYNQLLNVN